MSTAAAAVARDVTLVDPAVIREIASRAIAVYREVRPRARALTDEQLAATLAEEFRRKRLSSDDLLAELDKRRLADG